MRSSRGYNESELRKLRYVARLAGVQPSYTHTQGHTEWAHPETMLRLITLLTDRQVESTDDLDALAKELGSRRHHTTLEPVYVFWGGRLAASCKALAEILDTHSFELRLESGTLFEADFILNQCRFKPDLPEGYHTLRLKLGGRMQETMIVSAPERLRVVQSKKKSWGIFAPLYGLRSSSDEGMGSLRELEWLTRESWNEGGSFVGTLPLLATHIMPEGPCDPSPYSALTKLFWNELYMNLSEALAHADWTPPDSYRERIDNLRREELVNYCGVAAIKHKIIQEVADKFFANRGDSSAAFQTFLGQRPRARDYAQFRAKNTTELRYHLFSQFEMERQLAQLSREAKSGRRAGLYLDFPVGVSKSGFDAQVFASDFVNGASAGAPPDSFFSHGQNWGFSPIHPRRIRESRYKYFIESLRSHMRHSTLLRVDHVMGLYRMYSVPDGNDARDGAYLRYKADELFAILCLEAERHGVDVIGEDLGTVPQPVRDMMGERGLKRLWVVEFEFPNAPDQALGKIPQHALMSVNTHDMAPFRGFVERRDLEHLETLGLASHKKRVELEKSRVKSLREWSEALLKPKDAESNKAGPRSKNESDEMYFALLRRLAEAPSPYLLVNIEDLWGETESQNMPGTWKEYPNWSRKLAVPIEEWKTLASFARLKAIMTATHRGRSQRREQLNENAEP